MSYEIKPLNAYVRAMRAISDAGLTPYDIAVYAKATDAVETATDLSMDHEPTTPEEVLDFEMDGKVIEDEAQELWENALALGRALYPSAFKTARKG